MANYPALHELFDGKQQLDANQQAILEAAVKEGLDSSIMQNARISTLAAEVRKCVEDLRFCPLSLESNATAMNTLTTVLNATSIRPIVDMIWSRAREVSSPGGTMYAQ